MDMDFSFSSSLWEHGGEASWVFLTVPVAESDVIAELVRPKPGFGSVRVEVRIGSTQLSTSLFPSKELAAYVLPVKRAVRDAESLVIGDTVSVSIRILPE